MEGASFALINIFNWVQSFTGKATRVSLTGSGANSETWPQILADIMQQPIEVTDASSEGRGAAILCATALGIYADVHLAIKAMVPVTKVIKPNAARASRYQSLLSEWVQMSNDHSSKQTP